MRCASPMNMLSARVEDGHFVLDPSAKLPKGTEVAITIVDPGDDLEAAERALLDDALARSWTDACDGKTRPAEELLARLRAKR